jgi:hypothetical protein
LDSFETLAVQLLESKHAIRFRATGRSMRPFIFDGDRVEIQPSHSLIFHRGDIVLYCLTSGRLLIHRVVRVHADRLLIQGDSMLAPDGWIDPKQVLGKASALDRNGKHIDLTALGWVVAGKLWALLTPLRCWFQILWHRLRARLFHG